MERKNKPKVAWWKSLQNPRILILTGAIALLILSMLELIVGKRNEATLHTWIMFGLFSLVILVPWLTRNKLSEIYGGKEYLDFYLYYFRDFGAHVLLGGIAATSSFSNNDWILGLWGFFVASSALLAEFALKDINDFSNNTREPSKEFSSEQVITKQSNLSSIALAVVIIGASLLLCGNRGNK
ncbi:MAG: hypothetical protein QM571_05100 [Micrococcaceae bacterium]